MAYGQVVGRWAIAVALIVASPVASAAAGDPPGSWLVDALDRLHASRTSPGPEVLVDGPALEQALLAAANAQRAASGLGPLAPDPRLVAVSRGHSRDMATRGYFGHFDPDGRGPGERLQRDYGEWRGAYAENVYHVSSADALAEAERTPDALADRIVRGWMASPGHRANLLRAEMSLAGLGVWSTRSDVWATHLLGRPIAILAAPMPACVPTNQARKVGLRLGPDLQERGAFDALLVWPDPNRRFFLPDGTYLEGAEPLRYRRTGEQVELTIPGLKLLGTYRLRLGREGRYYDLGAFQVETWCGAP